jgi:hypothetical protein
MVASKRGRPALPGARHASGGLREAQDPRVENIFRRFVDLEKTVGLDPRLTSQIGRLRYLKLITDAQAVAADKVGQIYGRFERAHLLRRFSVSPSYQIGRGRIGRARPTHACDDAEILAAQADYDAVQDCIPTFPRSLREAVEQLCVENCAVPAWQLDEVRRVLDKVAQAFGLAGAQAVRVAAAGTRKRVRAGRSPQVIAEKARQKSLQGTRQEKFEAGAYVARAADATPRPSHHHVPGSVAERDHAALVRRLEEAQRRREGSE